MKVAVCYYPHREGHNSIFPLLAFQKDFEAIGIKLIFSSKVDKLLSEKPDLFVLSGFSVTKLLKANRLVSADDLLSKVAESNIPLIYLSGNDATGPIDLKVLDKVDLYLMRQVLRDKELYLHPLRRHYFRDRYMKQFRFKNEESFPLTQIRSYDLHKIGLSWNLALIDWKTQTNNKVARYFHILRKNRRFKSFHPGKTIDLRCKGLTFRGNLFHGTHDVSRLHRLQSLREYLLLGKSISIAEPGIISYKEYIEEMKNTSLCISPFGWGEVCYRDFEAFQQGTLLVKPDMQHIDTYPNLYTEASMISYKWDASDLKEKVGEVMGDLKKYDTIAKDGHHSFLKYTSGPKAGTYFVHHFQGIIDSALSNFKIKKVSSS